MYKRQMLHFECHILTVATGRALCYLFFGSLLLADAGSALGTCVGGYLAFVGLAMLYVSRSAVAKLRALMPRAAEASLRDAFARHDSDSDGKLSKAEFAELCEGLGEDLTPRERECARREPARAMTATSCTVLAGSYERFVFGYALDVGSSDADGTTGGGGATLRRDVRGAPRRGRVAPAGRLSTHASRWKRCTRPRSSRKRSTFWPTASHRHGRGRLRNRRQWPRPAC